MQRDEETRLKEDIKRKNLEIMERDTMIGDKEKKIYSLKRKTQELEKFKFVLDYKIKELKRDIAPRGMEINRLRKETNDMDETLRICNATNSALGFTVDDLRTRQEEMQEIIRASRTRIRKNDIYIQ
jgi:chromosome segregation ATPase